MRRRMVAVQGEAASVCAYWRHASSRAVGQRDQGRRDGPAGGDRRRLAAPRPARAGGGRGARERAGAALGGAERPAGTSPEGARADEARGGAGREAANEAGREAGWAAARSEARRAARGEGPRAGDERVRGGRAAAG